VSRPGAVNGVPGVAARQPAPSAAPPSRAPSQDAPVRAQFDTPGHIGAGDSVPGEPVVVRGIPFTPGQLAALVDFIGDLSTLEDPNTFTFDQVARMHYLLANGVEDAWAWDEATGGLYSNEAQANEKHFAPSPGDGGKNFRDQFIAFFAQALEAMGDGKRDQAELLSYTAEHYLQDAFSAGHALPAKDVAQDVELIMSTTKDMQWAPEIAHRVYASAAPTINDYEQFDLGWNVIDENRFKVLAVGGAYLKGNDGIADSVRRYIHEHLAKTGLEVASEAHPVPFMLYGDHDLGGAGAAESVKAMQDALAETRRVLARGASDLGTATPIATALFERHWPRPTAAGQRTVEGAIQAGTGSEAQIINAVVESMIATIADVMANVVTMTHGLVRKRTPNTLHFGKDPGIPPSDPYRASGAEPKP
jgi:hypothetical protein